MKKTSLCLISLLLAIFLFCDTSLYPAPYEKDFALRNLSIFELPHDRPAKLVSEQHRKAVLGIVTEKLNQIRGKYGIKACIIYGSLVVGEKDVVDSGLLNDYSIISKDIKIQHRFGKDSDIDIALISDEEVSVDNKKEIMSKIGENISYNNSNHKVAILYDTKDTFEGKSAEDIYKDRYDCNLMCGEIIFSDWDYLVSLSNQIKQKVQNGEHFDIQLKYISEIVKGILEKARTNFDKDSGNKYFDLYSYSLIRSLFSIHNAFAIVEVKRSHKYAPLVILKRQLFERGYGELYQNALGILGVSSLSDKDIRTLADFALELYDKVVAIENPNIPKDLAQVAGFWLLNKGAEKRWRETIKFLIHRGDFKEAMWPVLNVMILSHKILMHNDDGSAEIKEMFQKYDSVMELLGFTSEAGFNAKVEHVTKLLEGVLISIDNTTLVGKIINGHKSCDDLMTKVIDGSMDPNEFSVDDFQKLGEYYSTNPVPWEVISLIVQFAEAQILSTLNVKVEVSEAAGSAFAKIYANLKEEDRDKIQANLIQRNLPSNGASDLYLRRLPDILKVLGIKQSLPEGKNYILLPSSVENLRKLLFGNTTRSDL